ncbi:MarR family winged helix-turn-helix transcriptional regulator [Agrococcus carbonis]|uniref:DNA-binding transcriptional regulator, MarR family n=1 Tax=Agrococcus carbonis TaxID=684552 RepID=A0A1H1LPR5_9MICO|nr:MarR family transcriptional regulator [Agrococcus carbonis]SDR76310.1 DNA-binding transcriptional regulator, MarR family [Agrococcus carbonis]
MATGEQQRQEDDLLLERQVCFALSVASRSVVAAYRPVLAPLGLSHPQYLVMLALWGSSPMSLRELGEQLRLEPATLSPLVKRLEAAGLVQRARHEGDERRLDITVTERGRALREQALAVPSTMAERLGLDRDELRQLHGLMGRLIGAADQAPSA